jgi:NIPSNAP protein
MHASPIVELRQYELRPNARETLIELFDREFVEPQEELGMRIIGQFRDLDGPDRFVWLRGFADMESRAEALAAFYGGPVWKANSVAANATMIDVDNVLLLRPAHRLSGFDMGGRRRPPVGSNGHRAELVKATIWHIEPGDEPSMATLFERAIEPALADAGASVLASFVSEHSPNTFPALPVREDANVFVWFARFPGHGVHERYLEALAASPQWQEAVELVDGRLAGGSEVLRLAPTARSLV